MSDPTPRSPAPRAAASARRPVPNRLIESLGTACREWRLEEKWLLAPSRRVGRQWLEWFARTGGAAINVHVHTTSSLAAALVSAKLQTLRWMGRDEGPLWVASVWGELKQRADSRLAALDSRPGVAWATWHSLQTLRLAGLMPDDLESRAAVPHDGLDGDKLRELALLWRAYLRQLELHRTLDFPGALELAIAALMHGAANGKGGLTAAKVLVPQGLAMSRQERRLLDLMPRDLLVELAVDQPSERSDTDAALLSWIGDPSRAPAPRRDGTATLFTAAGEIVEVREALRRVLAKGLALDEIEILCADPLGYGQLLYEESLRLGASRDDDGTGQPLPLTFAEGIPCELSRPGRALRVALAWLRDGCPQQGLLTLFEEGLIGAERSGGATHHEYAERLRWLSIGRGATRTVEMIQAALAQSRDELARLALDSSPCSLVDDGAEEQEAAAARRRETLERRQRTLAGLLRRVRRLLPKPMLRSDSAPTGRELLRWAVQVVSISRAVSPLDGYAKRALVDRIQAMAQWIEQFPDVPWDGPGWLAELPRQTHVMGSGPRAGHLHVASLATGGHTGRAMTFVLGLDDGAFPGGSAVDPILPDHERECVDSELPTTSQVLEERFQRLERTLAGLRGEVSLSFACRAITDGRERFPSAALAAAARLIICERDADHATISQSLRPVAGFAPESAASPLDDGEWWLRRVGDHRDAEDGWLTHFSALARGAAANAARQGPQLTPYDGIVPQAGEDLNPLRMDEPRPRSASSLELAARCPLAFFFQYGLGVRAPDELSDDEDSPWLDAAQFGLLVHELLARFMREKRDQGTAVDFEHDLPLLGGMLQEAIEAWRAACPPPTTAAFRSQCADLEATARVFLDEEVRHAGGRTPRFFETSLGLPAGQPPEPLDQPTPLTLRLPSGDTLRALGRVDRIDELTVADARSQPAGGDRRFEIWDYKTGSPDRFRGGLQQGRRLQPLLYALLVESALQDSVAPHARVEQSGYLFVGERGQGERRAWSAEQLQAEGLPVLTTLCQLIGAGQFLPTNTPKQDCGYCDYQSVCSQGVPRTGQSVEGRLLRIGQSVDAKLESDAAGTRHYRELRRER